VKLPNSGLAPQAATVWWQDVVAMLARFEEELSGAAAASRGHGANRPIPLVTPVTRKS
jgi:hypothetical protein